MTHSAITPPQDAPDAVQVMHDVCALPLVRRLAAFLDRDPNALAVGDLLPRGWHVIMFNVPTRQSKLRPDGSGDLGVILPDLGLPRLMMGGRHILFEGDIPIGSAVRRETRLAKVSEKQGRSGRFALVDVEHRLFVEDRALPALVETVSYILREAATAVDAPKSPSKGEAIVDEPEAPRIALRQLLPTETLLFRYSSITDNPHRIHYDLPYAREVENYPALLVNGTIPSMFLLEMLRQTTGKEPNGFQSRNLAPMYCGVELTLSIFEQGEKRSLWARNPDGAVCLEASAW